MRGGSTEHRHHRWGGLCGAEGQWWILGLQQKNINNSLVRSVLEELLWHWFPSNVSPGLHPGIIVLHPR